ncbi:MAG: hypothetical protein M1547_10705 [Gammaproteobacteria bacterium]|nr:hypothetical protein [Gammaproteobacteria bacterium]
MQAQWAIAGEVVLQSFLALLLGGAVLALVLGIWMFFQPERVFLVNRFFSQWLSSRKLTRPLSQPVYHIERRVYRHHRVFGAALLAGAGYILYSLWFRYDKAAVLNIFREYNPKQVAWLLDSAVFLLNLTSIAALLVALCLIVRPSLLRGIEAWANRWFTTRHMEKPLEVMHMKQDEAAGRNPRVTALLLVLGSLYVLLNLGFLVFTLGWDRLLRSIG